MPKVKCSWCGEWNYGWALNYKPCHCSCGNYLRNEDIEEDQGKFDMPEMAKGGS